MDFRIESPGTDSVVESLASGEIKEECIFNNENFEKIENNESLSLQLLSNCIILANCTILKERNLLPLEYFREFHVYGDVYGYIMNQETMEGKKLAVTFNSVDVAIRERLIHKLAIVVEETFDTDPLETFVWSFSYSASAGASAEIGYHGQTSKFSVNYSDMNTTCQQFCKLIRDLKRIFKELRPLPYGMLPSLKVAYRGDPQFVDGFQPVDGFVNLQQIGVGTVSFPHNNGFHLTYASQFMETSRRPSFSVGSDNQILTEAPAFSPTVEVARRRTMGFEGETTEEHRPVSPVSPVMEVTRSVNDDVMNDVSMTCHPNVISQEETRGVLQSEIISPEKIQDKRSLNPEVDAPRPISRRSSQKKRALKKAPKEKKSTKKTSSKRKSPINKFKLPEDESEEIQSTQQKKKSARRLIPVPEPVEEEENEVEPKEIEEDKEISVPVEEKMHRQFGRVVSLLNLSSPDNLVPGPKKANRRYGRMMSIRTNPEEVSGENPESAPEQKKETKRYGRIGSIRAAPHEVLSDSDNLPERHGRIESVELLSKNYLSPQSDEQPTRYGRTNITRESPEKPEPEPSRRVQKYGQTKGIRVSLIAEKLESDLNARRYGRVTSLLSSGEPEAPRVLERRPGEESPKTPVKYARVPTIKNLVSQPRKLPNRRE